MKKTGSKLTVKSVGTIFIGLIGLVSAILGIYVFFFQDKKTLLEYEILSNANVLDINTNISKLDIIYDSTSLKDNNQNLKVINVRIKNNGTENILKNFYDNNAPIGLTVENGTIIEKPEIVFTSSEYIKNHLSIRLDSLGRVYFNEIILESGEYYTIKILVLHNGASVPGLISFGKIAGQKEIPIVSLVQQPKKKKSYWSEIFGGDILIQAVRAIFYFLGVVILIVLITIFISEIINVRNRRKRNRIVKEFKETVGYEYNKMDDAIFSRFSKQGSKLLEKVPDLATDVERLNKTYSKLLEELKKGNRNNQNKKRSSLPHYGSFIIISDYDAIMEMVKDGLVIKNNDKLVVNQAMRETLIHFLNYLTEIEYPKKKKSIKTAINVESESDDKFSGGSE